VLLKIFLQVLPSRFPEGIWSQKRIIELTEVAKKCLEESKIEKHKDLLKNLNNAFAKGTVVEIHGLTSEKGVAINGKRAKIIEKPLGGRISVVVLEGKAQSQSSLKNITYRLKPVNLRAIPATTTYGLTPGLNFIELQREAISIT
jgi:hypothetical protein